jgi:outer membrane protein assembly factor BamB
MFLALETLPEAGLLYLYDEKGTMKLVKASADSFEKTGEFKVPAGGKGPYWAHPVVCGGRLYLRHDDTIFAYDIAKN